jgi:hypothetical protein
MLIYETAEKALAAARTKSEIENRLVNIHHAYDSEGTYWIVDAKYAEIASRPKVSLATWVDCRTAA